VSREEDFHGRDSAGKEFSKEITMNGMFEVDISGTSILRIEIPKTKFRNPVFQNEISNA